MRDIIPIADAVNWGHSLNRGLISWWLALPEQQRGVIFRDLCMRNHGVLVSMDPATDWGGPRGRPGGWGSLDLDGTNDRLRIANNARQFVDHFTLSTWIYKRTTTYGTLYSRWLPSDGLIIYVDFVARGISVFLNSVLYSSTTNIFNRDEWAYLTITYNRAATDLRYYVNGNLADSDSANTVVVDTANDLLWGASDTAGAEPLNAILDDMRFYGRCLSVSEVGQLYTLSRCGYPGLLNRIRRRMYAPEQAAGGGYVPFAHLHGMTGGMLSHSGGLCR